MREQQPPRTLVWRTMHTPWPAIVALLSGTVVILIDALVVSTELKAVAFGMFAAGVFLGQVFVVTQFIAVLRTWFGKR